MTCQGKNEIFQTRHCCIRFSSRRLKDETITQGNEWMDGSIKRFNPNHDISLNLTKLFCARPNLNLVLSCHSDGQGLILSIDLEDLLQHIVSLCHFSTVYAVLPKRSYTFLFLENVTNVSKRRFICKYNHVASVERNTSSFSKPDVEYCCDYTIRHQHSKTHIFMHVHM